MEDVRKFFLFNVDDILIATFDTFDKNTIKVKIIEYLTANPSDMLTFEKEYNKADKKKYVGNEVLGVFEVNPKSNKVSKLITKWDRTFYSPLEN